MACVKWAVGVLDGRVGALAPTREDSAWVGGREVISSADSAFGKSTDLMGGSPNPWQLVHCVEVEIWRYVSRWQMVWKRVKNLSARFCGMRETVVAITMVDDAFPVLVARVVSQHGAWARMGREG